MPNFAFDTWSCSICCTSVNSINAIQSRVISEAYTARLQAVQRLKAVPSGLDSLHSQQTKPAMASNGRATWSSCFEAIAPLIRG